MKRSLVFVPAILIALFLLNSFVPKEKEASEKLREERQSFTGVKLGGKCLKVKNSIAKVDLNESGILFINETLNHCNTRGNRVKFSIAIQRPNTVFNLPVPEYVGSVEQANLKTILKSCYSGDVILIRILRPGKHDSIKKIKVEGNRGC